MTSSPSLLAAFSLFATLVVTAEAAHAAEPTTAACLAATESSLVLRNQHKLRDARAQLLICSAASCPADVRDECVHRIGQINAAIPTVVFVAKDAAGNDLAAVQVLMDGNPIAAQLDGSAIAIDPGEHAFVFESAGRPTVRKRFVIHEGEKGRRERIAFSVAVVSSPPAPAPASDVAAPVVPPPAQDASSGLGTQRILAIVAAGVGIVGVGVGTGYGLSSRSKHEEAVKVCGGPSCPGTNGVDLWNQAVSAGNTSTIGFIVGGVGLAAGAVLWFTAPRSSGEADARAGASTQIVFGPTTLQLRGTW